MLYILFGLPGAGKTYVGKIFEKYYGYYCHDGDTDIPKDMKQKLIEGRTILGDKRDEFFTLLLYRIKVLQESHEKLVVTQTFIKEKYRKQLLDQIPESKFILINSDRNIREERLRNQSTYPLEYLMNMENYFDVPEIQHNVIVNNEEGDEKIKEQIEKLIET